MEAPVVRGAVLPRQEPAGRLPAAWEGRSPQEEEERLRKEGKWDTGRMEYFAQWGAVDAPAALLAARSTQPRAITAATVGVVTGWFSADPSAVQDWINRQPANYERTLYVRAVLQAFEQGGTRKSGGGLGSLSVWMTGQLAMPGIAPVAAVYLDQWAGENRSGAYAWVADQITDTEVRSKVLAEQLRLTASRGEEALSAVAAWLQSAPAGQFQEELTLAYIREAVRLDPESARQWAGTIRDATLRQTALEICGKSDAPDGLPAGP